MKKKQVPSVDPPIHPQSETCLLNFFPPEVHLEIIHTIVVENVPLSKAAVSNISFGVYLDWTETTIPARGYRAPVCLHWSPIRSHCSIVQDNTMGVLM